MRLIGNITVLLAALAIAACGEDDGTAGAASGGKDKMRDAALKFARCMREQGVDFPDPKAGEDGGIQMAAPSAGAGGRGKLDAAHEECQKHLAEARPPKLSEAERSKMREASLKHARCMREQGIDFPDPQFSEDGGVRMRIGPGSGIDPRSPKFQRAQEACAKELGERGGSFSITREGPAK